MHIRQNSSDKCNVTVLTGFPRGRANPGDAQSQFLAPRWLMFRIEISEFLLMITEKWSAKWVFYSFKNKGYCWQLSDEPAEVLKSACCQQCGARGSFSHTPCFPSEQHWNELFTLSTSKLFEIVSKLSRFENGFCFCPNSNHSSQRSSLTVSGGAGAAMNLDLQHRCTTPNRSHRMRFQYK